MPDVRCQMPDVGFQVSDLRVKLGLRRSQGEEVMGEKVRIPLIVVMGIIGGYE